jgi:hypothetical protein
MRRDNPCCRFPLPEEQDLSDARPLRQIITVMMNLLIIVAVLLVVRIVVEFFGTLSATTWADPIIALTSFLVIPFGLEPVKTPFGGVFDIDAALTIGIVLIAEWALSVARNRA